MSAASDESGFIARRFVRCRPRSRIARHRARSRYTMGKMKIYASFDEYLKAQRTKNKEIIRALRTFVKRIEPKLSEAVKWGNGCWIGSNGPVAYVYLIRSTCNSASFADPP
jgi:hypothetical protein